MKNIRRNIIYALSVVMVLAMLSAFMLPTSAASDTSGEYKWLRDEADVLSDECEAELEEMLEEIKRDYDYNVYFASVQSLGSKTSTEYADDLYDSLFPVNSTGILFLVSLEYRDYWLSTSGDAISLFDADGRLGNIDYTVLQSLKRNDFEDAAKTFALLVKSCLEAVNRYEQDKDTNPKAWSNSYCALISDYWVPRTMPAEYKSFSFKGIGMALSELGDDSMGIYDYGREYLADIVKRVLIVLAIAAVVAFVWLSVMKSKMNNIKNNDLASNYVRPNSFDLTRSSDLFLYSQVTQVARPRPDSSSSSGGGGSHGSSSGGSHGGSGGKF